MKLNMKITKIKAIDSLELDFPLERGLYAITGENGSGKSTVMASLAQLFFRRNLKSYFGQLEQNSEIKFSLNQYKKIYKYKDNGRRDYTNNGLGKDVLQGFYEGSLIYGNRFRNTNFNDLRKLTYIESGLLVPTNDYILKNLGKILHNDQNFYDGIFKAEATKLQKQGIKINGDLFYLKKGNKLVSQFHMSTGENLLVSILNSLDIRNVRRTNTSIPCLILLDEIELALHPASLKRLVEFLRQESEKYNYAIYFSTHSIELISQVKPDNIFFFNRRIDNTIKVVNPCYPAYATRSLYDQDGYDFVILVEDDLARGIINRILLDYSLLNSKRVHVLPAGGYTNVLDLAHEVVSSNLLGKKASVSVILDGDVEDKAKSYITKNNIKNNIPVNYLPIESLEKYFKKNLIDKVNENLFNLLSDYVFQQKSLEEICQDYKNSGAYKNDANGKKFYKLIDDELRERNKSRIEIVDMVVKFLIDEKSENLQKIVTFLQNQLGK